MTIFIFLDNIADVTISSNAPLVADDQVTWQFMKTEKQREPASSVVLEDAENINSTKPMVNIHKNIDDTEDSYGTKDMYVLYFDE